MRDWKLSFEKEKAMDAWSKSSTSSAEGTTLHVQDIMSQISSLLQEWLHHNVQVKNVYDTHKCENFVSQLRISWTLQQQ